MLGYAPDMSRLLIMVLCCLPLLVSAGEFYKWVDNKGVTHYEAKKPKHDAEVVITVDPPASSSSSSPAPYSSQSSNDGDESNEANETGYSQFSIAKPESDETIRSNEGIVNISFFITPGLRSGHKIAVTLDGQKLKDQMSSTQFSLKDLPRGTHTLKADIVDAKGQTLSSTNAVSFHLRQHSILNPK